ncbi:MAG TPA: hypothetical protein VF128_00895 [Gemmatimonadaceae bacterium]
MRSIRLKKTLTALVLAATVAACVDAPSEPLAASAPLNNPLAASFDVLADEMATNDVERSEEFRWAALSLRSGVTPSVLQVTNEGRAELYDSFVYAVTWTSLTQALRPPLHRSLVAWRRSGDVLQVLLVGLVSDSAPVLHPYSLRATSASPVAGATAAYFERGSSASSTAGSSWIGIGGVAKVAEFPRPELCTSPNGAAKPDGVNCQLTRFGVSLNVLFARTRSRDSRDVDLAGPSRRVIAPATQTVNGVKLVFSCATPGSTGCK